MFDVVGIDALSADEVRAILQRREAELRLRADAATLRRIVELCDQFLPATAGPGQPLRLLERVKHYADEKAAKGEPEAVGPGFVEKVFSIYSGLPPFVVDARATVRVNDIGRWFGDRVMGQQGAIAAVVESIVMFNAAINDPGRPLGTFLFAGPTGVGKTELAKALATYLFGSERRLLRFDMSEFASFHAYRQLIGDADGGGTPGSLTDPVRRQPFQVVLFDELEKGHPNIQDLLLQILDGGRLADGGGRAVDFRNAFVIATTNVGSEAATRRRRRGSASPATRAAPTPGCAKGSRPSFVPSSSTASSASCRSTPCGVRTSSASSGRRSSWCSPAAGSARASSRSSPATR